MKSIGFLLLILVALGASVSCSSGPVKDNSAPEEVSFLPYVKSHLDKQLATGTDRFGPLKTAIWCANIDTRTGEPLDASHVPGRVYRLIGAPGGSNLYWDQPLVVAACQLSEINGDEEYAAAAKDYIRDFLRYCVDGQGMYVWGNHQYYDVYGDSLVYFHGGYHEMRPLVPAWQLFWEQDSAGCSRYLREMAGRHIYDSSTGGFNRHDDGKAEHPFLEAGAVLAETLAWLYSKEHDPGLSDLARRVAEFTYGYRGEATGLVRCSPGSGRWDDFTCTTEIGLWAQSLLKAADYTGDGRFAKLAGNAVRAYLKYGFDPETGLYYGQLNTKDGSHRTPDSKGYWPGEYSNIWNTDQWPTHDYPMNFAEACLTLYEKTGDRVFAEGARRWAGVISKQQVPESGSYAENFGRCIHFLVRASEILEMPELKDRARDIADLAIEHLYENGMFQGLPGSHAYEAVDGVGYLCLALISLESDQDVDFKAFSF